MPSVLLRVSRRDPFDLNPEAQPPYGEFAQSVKGMRGRKRDTVVGPNSLRKTKLFEGALEDREGEFLLRGEQCLAGEQVATGEVGDRQGIALAAIAEEKFPFVVRTPERIWIGGPREERRRTAVVPAPAAFH